LTQDMVVASGFTRWASELSSAGGGRQRVLRPSVPSGREARSNQAQSRGQRQRVNGNPAGTHAGAPHPSPTWQV